LVKYSFIAVSLMVLPQRSESRFTTLLGSQISSNLRTTQDFLSYTIH
jgi:hypothetical protein